MFSQEYINNNYSPTLGLKYGDTYIKTLDNTTLNITKLVPLQSDGLACEIDEILPANSDVTVDNQAVKISGYNNDKTEITIGSTTYKITKESGDCIYLEPKDSSTGEKYVLIQETTSDGIGFSLHKFSELAESRTEHEKMYTPGQLTFDKSPNTPSLFITELKLNT